MNIAVVLRLMPSLGDELEIDDTGVDIDREIVEMVINEFDDQALEEAVLIKEATGATVTALALAGRRCRAGAPRRLRPRRRPGRARRRRRDRAVRHAHGVAARSRRRCVELGSDLVLTGVQTPYDVFGQTAPYLAAELGWPQANVVVGTTVTDGTARVVQEYAGGRLAVLALTLPAVVGVQSASARRATCRWRACARPCPRPRPRRSVSPSSPRPRLPRSPRWRGRSEPAGATMLEGDAEEVAAKTRGAAARARSSGGLMGDVLVYIEQSSIRRRPRPLACSAGRGRSRRRAAVRSSRSSQVPDGRHGRPAGRRRRRAGRPSIRRCRPYLPEAHQAVLVAAIAARTPDVVVLENTTSGYDLAAASAVGAGLPFVGYCRGGLDRRRAGHGRRAASTPDSSLATHRDALPAVFSVTVDRAARRGRAPAGRGELDDAAGTGRARSAENHVRRGDHARRTRAST